MPTTTPLSQEDFATQVVPTLYAAYLQALASSDPLAPPDLGPEWTASPPIIPAGQAAIDAATLAKDNTAEQLLLKVGQVALPIIMAAIAKGGL